MYPAIHYERMVLKKQSFCAVLFLIILVTFCAVAEEFDFYSVTSSCQVVTKMSEFDVAQFQFYQCIFLLELCETRTLIPYCYVL